MIKTPYKLPLADLKAEYMQVGLAVEEAFKKIASEGMFILGPYLEEFEEDFARYLQVRHCVGVASGTGGLVMALKAYGIGPGHQVILPAFTFKATGLAVILSGAEGVFVDINPKTGNINHHLIEKYITQRTKAIIPVHLYGNPCPLDPVMKIAQKYGIRVIEDACEAHGSGYNGKKAGVFGDCGVFSFYPSKNLGGYGDGGCIVTNCDRFADKLRKMRGYGNEGDIGFNCRLSSINGALLKIKLPFLDRWNQKRRMTASLYRKYLADLPVEFFSAEPDCIESYYLFVIMTEQRDQLQKHLIKHGIEARVHFEKPLYEEYDAFRDAVGSKDCPCAKEVASKVLSLPMHPFLQEDNILFIAEKIREFFD